MGILYMHGLVQESSDFPADTLAFIVMNVMPAVQVYCFCMHLFGKCPFMLNPPGGYLSAVRYEHQNRARNGPCCMNQLCVFQQGFRLVLVTGIHGVSSSQKPLMSDLLFAQPSRAERVPEEQAVFVEDSHPPHEADPLIELILIYQAPQVFPGFILFSSVFTSQYLRTVFIVVLPLLAGAGLFLGWKRK